jgi:hypothetical protein
MGISTCIVGPPLGGLDVQEHSLCCTPPQKTQNIWHHMAPGLKFKVFNTIMHTITDDQLIFLFINEYLICIQLSLKNYQYMIFHVQFDAVTVVKIHPLVF